ncbi:MAG: protein sorting system archaetidylserine synthase [Halobacteriales archaeon]|nr:protein sorting system archaetidylserine synthase [Halobacteriales archaeon]
MRPRFVQRLGPADVITVANAVVGFAAAAAAAAGDVALGAQLMLLAAMGDGLDGVVARRYGGSPVGSYLDSLADVAAFGVAPALVVFVAVRQGWALEGFALTAQHAAALAVPALFLAMVVVRLAFYTADQTDIEHTLGVPSTLSATLLGSTVLAGHGTPTVLLVGGLGLSYLMIADLRYPDLLARDALLMGVVHGLAVAFPDVYGRGFPYALLTLAIAYLVLGPRFYWRDWADSGARA